MDLDQIEALVEQLQKQVQSLKQGNGRSRQEAVTTATHISRMLETPGEWLVRTTWAEPSHLAVVRIASDKRLFNALNADNASPKTTAHLAETCEIQVKLAAKVLRVLASMDTIREIDKDTWASSDISKAMATTNFQRSIEYMYPFIVETNGHAPAFFAERGYQLPTDPFDGIVQYAKNGKGKHAIQLYQEHGFPDGLTKLMEAWHSGRPHWSDEEFFPVKDRLINGSATDSDAVFMVDVGGGSGHDLIKFVERHLTESFRGGLILQDIPEVIGPLSDLPHAIQASAHDFMEPQPVKGARVYFLHSIIHDHPDPRSVVILKQIAQAMKKGYSKLIIWDIVLEDKGVPPGSAALDWEMMTFFAASERTEKQWVSLLEHPEVGMKVNGFWHYSQYDQCILEAELA